MSHTSYRPPKTYSHRRSRVHAISAVRPTLSSSPRQDPDNEDDVTPAELSRGLKKRSHQQTQLPNTSPFLSKEARDVKNKTTSPPGSPEMPRNFAVLPLRTQNIDPTSYETPYISVAQDPSAILSTSRSIVPDNLSPVPATRRILSRISSQNLKENVSRNLNSGLASPFNSRPGSRAASPNFSTQGPVKRPRLHAKSRTLSSHMAVLSQNPTAQLPAEVVSSAVLQSKPLTTNHNRTASIPTMPSVSVDQLDPQCWFIPPKALSRSPGIHGQLDDLLSDHPSFSFDVPADVSTPARMKSKEISIYTDDSLDMDITMREASLLDLIPPVAPKQPGRRRCHTIMQAPSDSLFSSMLDFSAYVTDEESPNHIRRSHGPSALLQELAQPSFRLASFQDLGIGLGSAFSPALPHADAETMLEPASPSNAAIVRAQVTTSPRRNELSDLLLTMDISNIPVTGEPQFLSSSPASNILPPPQRFGHRRKRGDTIRASDFARPPDITMPDVLPSVSTGNITEQPKLGSSRNTRRMRSGTITLANVHETLPSASPAIIERIVPRVKPESSKHRRRRDVLPRFKRTIHDEPLTPPGSDESDDELLLTGEEWMDPATEDMKG